MYVITGATGHIGGRIAGTLLDRGEQVRVISRVSAHLEPLVRRGAEPAEGDLRDSDFLTEALRGARGIFTMIPPNYGANDFRTFQNQVGEALATGIRRSGCESVVNLSSQGADLPAGSGPILGLRDQERRLNGLEHVHVLHLRPSYFMENLLMFIPMVIEHDMAGSAIRGDLPFAMIATCDIAERAAGHLLHRDFMGKQVEDLLGPRDLSLNEAIGVLGRRIGKPKLSYLQFTYEQAEAGMLATGIGADAARLFIDMSRALNEGRFAVGLRRTGHNTTPTAVERFAETFADAYEHALHPHAA